MLGAVDEDKAEKGAGGRGNSWETAIFIVVKDVLSNETLGSRQKGVRD